jgi:soluble lytic murein transglycosylase-like protein
MKRLALVFAFVAAASFGAAQSVQQYLALRKQHGVTAPVGVQVLNTLVGSKVLEIRGIVKGSFRVGERAALMVERPDGGSEIIDAAAVPDWLLGNETPARLLVKASRAKELEPMRAVLIGAAPEVDIARIEKEEAKKKAAANAAAKKQRASAPASRGGGLSGPIGRGARGAKYTPPTRQWVLPASEVTPVYASFIKKQNKRLSDAEALRIAEGIVGFSLHYKVDPRLIIAMIISESGFDPGAVSRVGAMGLGQLMPGTAKWMGVQNPFDSVENIYGAVKLMRTHLNQYNDSLPLSLAAYNAGAGAVKRHGGVPPYRETQNYVRKVIAIYYQLAGINS